jgi:hypothetical protein
MKNSIVYFVLSFLHDEFCSKQLIVARLFSYNEIKVFPISYSFLLHLKTLCF